jgi:hypothetical protein
MATITNLNDVIISQNALQAFTEELAPLSVFSKSYSDETTKKGTPVMVPLFGNLVATTFNQDYQVGGGAVTGVTVNLNIHKIVPLSLTDAQVANSSIADLEKWGWQAGQALAQAVITDVFSLITSVNFGVPLITTTSSNWSYAQANKLRRFANVAKMPLNDRTLFLDPTSMEALLNDSAIKGSFYTQLAEAAASGLAIKVAGWSVRESNLILTTDVQYAFGVHPSAIALAIRYLQPINPQAYAACMQLTDAKTGLSMGYRRHYQPANGTEYANFECLWGRAVGLSTAILRVSSPGT